MIRNAVISPLARLWRTRATPALLEVPAEYVFYLAGWVAWCLDWVVRLPSLWSAGGGRVRHGDVTGEIVARVVVLTPPGPNPVATLSRARVVCQEAAVLLGRYGVGLSLEKVSILPLPPGLRLPTCGVTDLLGRFFSWASARSAPSPVLTIYFVEELGNLAGCSIPGTDWIIVGLGTDGTTVVHELGHLADLWRHHPDPANVMTARPGGTHDGITPSQLAMIRTSRFVRPARAALVWRGDRD